MSLLRVYPRGSCPAALALVWLLMTAGAFGASERSSFEKIDDAYRNGVIDYSVMLVEKATALFVPSALSSEYKSATPEVLKSGTGLVMAVVDNWDYFSPEQQNLLAGFLGRPTKQCLYGSPAGYFNIHYDTTGNEGVPSQDADGDGIPDFVERVALYCDSARATFIAHLGYLPPPIDGDLYDIYLLSFSAYGITFPEGAGDSTWNDRQSYIGIHYNFLDISLWPNEDPDGDSIGAQKVTSAHEYFHAVQFAYDYDPGDNLWLMELSATWMEEVVFPEVNDNHNLLPYFFSAPEVNLKSTDAYHQYGAFVWAAFLFQRFDPSSIRLIWEACRYNSSLAANDSALAAFGSDLDQAFPEFTIWNYYTGARAIPGLYYAEAADYPLIDVDQTLPVLVHDSLQPIRGPDGLASNYVILSVDDSARGVLELTLEGSEFVSWAMADAISAPGVDTAEWVIVKGMIPPKLYMPFIEDYTTVTVIPSVVSPFLTANNYFLTSHLLPYGDANYDNDVNVGDVTYIINYVFRSGPKPRPVMESGDANCDGIVNVADAVRIISFVFKNGEEPCAGRVPE